jgi:DNA polymerase
VIVTLGNFATKFVLSTPVGITRLRGQVHDWHGRTVIPTFHPAAILHGGGERSRQFQLLREDFSLIQRTLAVAAAPPTPAAAPAETDPVPDTDAIVAPGEIARLRIVPAPPPDPDVDQLELF